MAIPRMCPIFLESAKIPLAMPKSFLLTLVIIALFDGDWNKPLPMPKMPDAMIICQISVEVLNVENISNDVINTQGPIRVRSLLPYFPAKYPLIGATIINVNEYGKINNPALNASKLSISIK